VIKEKGEREKLRQRRHTDTMYLGQAAAPRPLLYSLETPSKGGDTCTPTRPRLYASLSTA